jgi:hypothetical protein
MIEFISYWSQVFKIAFKHALDIAQAIIFILIIIFGIIAKYNTIFKVDMNSWQVAIFILGIILIIRLIMSPYWIYKAQKLKIESLTLSKPLKIFFDSKNSSKKFWSLENTPDPTNPGKFLPPHWEYRIEVENTSNKTVKNCHVQIERTGYFSVRPVHSKFDINKKKSCSIQPKCKVLIPIHWWCEPRIEAGLLAGDDVPKYYGPIKVTVSGDDILPTVKEFQFDYQKEPMIYE